jgi:hypothetical protein
MTKILEHGILIHNTATPLKNMKFRWNYEIPNIWKVIKVHGSKPPTSHILTLHKSGDLSGHNTAMFFGRSRCVSADLLRQNQRLIRVDVVLWTTSYSLTPRT